MNKMLQEELQSVFRAIRINTPEKTRVIITAENDTILPLLRFLKEKGFGYLVLISCVDWIEEQEFELIYILSSYLRGGNSSPENHQTNIIIKTRVPRENPEFETAIPIFQNAEPYERELHELYGIRFKNHPRLVPLFLDREYSIPPFRKDFDTRGYVKDVFDQVPFVDEEVEKA